MGSVDRRSIVNELQGEMDDLHHLQYNTDYSTDVNRKMQVPPRLSMEPEEPFRMDPPSPTPNLNIDMDGLEGSPAHAMNVPDRILIAGSDQHVGMRQVPRELDLDNITRFPPAGDNVGLTTPPRTLTLDEVSFPTVGDAKSAMKGKAASGTVRQLVDTNSSMVSADNTSMMESAPTVEWQKLQQRVHLLAGKVVLMEEAGRRRDRRDHIVMGIGIVYLLFRGLRFLFRSPYP